MRYILRNKVFFVTVAVALAFISTVFLSCSNSSSAKPNFIFKNAPRSDLVAKIGNEEITEERLIGDNKIAFFDLKKQEYKLKMDRLNELLVEILVGQEAKKAGVPLEEFIEKNITKGQAKVTESEFKAFIKERRFPENQINDQIKGQIFKYLENEKQQKAVDAYVAKLTKSNNVEVYFQKPKMDIKIEVGSAPTYGPENAPIQIVVFSEFQCPFCSRVIPSVNKIKEKYGNKVRIAFKHFPLPMHQDAKPAAEASLCVNEQSSKLFWKFHDKLFENQTALGKAELEKYAKEIGADVAKFNACVASNKFTKQVESDTQYGEKVGVRATPTFFINGQIVSGALPFESFKELIDEELADKK